MCQVKWQENKCFQKNLVTLKINYSFYCVSQVHGLILYTFKQEKCAPVKHLATLTVNSIAAWEPVWSAGVGAWPLPSQFFWDNDLRLTRGRSWSVRWFWAPVSPAFMYHSLPHYNHQGCQTSICLDYLLNTAKPNPHLEMFRNLKIMSTSICCIKKFEFRAFQTFNI